jgi:hypothetical protein
LLGRPLVLLMEGTAFAAPTVPDSNAADTDKIPEFA